MTSQPKVFFDRRLSALSGKEVVASRIGLTTAYLSIANCRIRNNRTRGILAHNNVCIEECEIAYQGNEGILLAPDLYWQEGPVVTNARVLRNKVSYSGKSSVALGAIAISAFDGEFGKSHYEMSSNVNSDIEILNNTLVNVDIPSIYIANSSRASVFGNRLSQGGAVGVRVSDSDDILLKDNVCASVTQVCVTASNNVRAENSPGFVVTSKCSN